MPIDLDFFVVSRRTFGMKFCYQELPKVEIKLSVFHPINEKLLIFEFAIIVVDMNQKKSKSQKSESAGISLEPDLKRDARELAERMGFGSLSNYTRFLLTQELARARGEKCYKLNEEAQAISYRLPQSHDYSPTYRQESIEG